MSAQMSSSSASSSYEVRVIDADDDSSLSDSSEEAPESSVGYFARIKRSVSYSVGTSALGRQAIIRYLPYETQNLIQALYKLVELDTGSKDAAFQLESRLMKFLVKLAIDHEAKKISYKDLLLADGSLRAAFELLLKLFYYYGDDQPGRDLLPSFEKVEKHLLEVVEIVRGIIKRTVRWTPKELDRLPKIVNTVGSALFLTRIWAHPDAEPPLLDLYDAMLKYTAFHYYSKTSGDLSKPTRDLSRVTIRATKKVNKLISNRSKSAAQPSPTIYSASTPELRLNTKSSNPNPKALKSAAPSPSREPSSSSSSRK